MPRTSEVTTVVTYNGDGTYTYNYTVKNTSPAPQSDPESPLEVWPLIVDFEVPLDSPSVVWGTSSPETWNYEFISYGEYLSRFGEPNPFGSPYVLHWYDTDPPTAPCGAEVAFKPIAPSGYTTACGGSNYEPSTDGFIFTSNYAPVDVPYLTSWVDLYRNIGGTPGFTPVPEPSTFLLLGAGAVIALRRRSAMK